ncbi:hypothetical protein DRQ07_11450 [candidate division KSB1 bacterium]|nr:MAG: hypothetical protein DRQ07_11450 [candidate division KSB1 bacterium]
MRKRLTDHPEFLKTAAVVRREIPDDYKYNKSKLKHLKHILHNTNVALGTLTSILNEFSKIKGPDISPDGLLGGIGYIIPIKDIKQSVNNAVHNLSDIADCIADELTNPKWNGDEDKEIKKLIKEKDKAVEKVEEEMEENEEEVTPEDVVTSEELVEKNSKILTAAIKKSLVNFYCN